MKKIILASGSPRRKEILSMLGLDFEVIKSEYEEDMSIDLSPKELVMKFSYEKAIDVAKKCENSLVIGADTVVVFDGKSLGKPISKEDSKNTLMKLSGNKHKVITGFTIIDTDTNKVETVSVETYVYFRDIPESEIDNYVETGDGMDKAGSYGVQTLGSVFVEKVEGDHFNVIGLPVCEFVKTLKRFGINVL